VKHSIFLCLFLFAILAVLPLEGQDLFWEDPEILVTSNAQFPQAATGGGYLVILWHEFIKESEETGSVYLNLLVSRDGQNWEQRRRFAGPFRYAGEDAPISSLAVDSRGRILVAVASGERELTIYNSANGGETFTILSEKISFSITVTPRLFVKEDGGLILYVTQESEESLSIFYSLSDLGYEWEDFTPLIEEDELRLNFLPYHMSSGGREYVVFQTFLVGERSNYQLYLKSSDDGGRSWSEPVWLTDFTRSSAGNEEDPTLYDNQRPFGLVRDGKLYLTWERGYWSENPQIYYGEYDLEGELLIEPQRVTEGGRVCKFPRLEFHDGRTWVVWFDNRYGDEHVFIARKRGFLWPERDLSRMRGSSVFGLPLTMKGYLYVVWQNNLSDLSRLVLLEPDRTVSPPVPVGENFRADGRYSQDEYRVSWNLPGDSSGIAGFSYTWSRDPEEKAPERLMTLQNEREAEKVVREDGEWYFHLAAQDYAGNWSETATISFFRDTTPPGPVSFEELITDERGYLISNTYTFEWEPPPEEEYIGGYSYNLEYLGPYNREVDTEELSPQAPSGNIRTRSSSISYNNQDNGLWALSVRAVDTVGNAGETSTLYFRMNKYIPVTYITSVSADQDELGTVTLFIQGRGFSVGGEIEEVYLDRDGEEPYDYTFFRENGLYQVRGDRRIEGPVIEEVQDGTYRVGVLHPSRGLYFTGEILELSSLGTVKFGNFGITSQRVFKAIQKRYFTFTFNNAMLWLLLAFTAFLLVFSISRIGRLAAEGRALRLQARALVLGGSLTKAEKKERILRMKKRGMGLRIKFTIFITMLMIVVVTMVSVPLGLFMVETQRQNLGEGLKKETNVLLDSLVSAAENSLPRKDTLELGLIPGQRTAMEDSQFATITGSGVEDPEGFDYVWASDDPDLLQKIDAEEFVPGMYSMEDRVSPLVPELQEEINREARQRLSEITEQLDALGERAKELALSTEEGAAEELRRYQQEITALEQQVNETLNEIGAFTGSVPDFNAETLNEENTQYVFYKPVVYRTVGEDVYYRGLVRLGVSTERIIREINASVELLIQRTVIIAAVAVALGILGALGLATIIIIPITKLVRGVEVIRDTEDKEQLKDHLIALRSRDELSVLADTVNQMTTGLVKAAAASKDLTMGKEIQKMFIPLEKDARGNKLTTGKEVNQHTEFFGYYEGAKGVSGDYFDYRKIDDKHYAIVKCDVAGKGIPAALIMVEVATIFLDFFKEWDLKKDGIHGEKLAYRINDLLEERGFKGRFAALIVVVLNMETGACYFCNAGDNLVHIYENATRRMITKELPEAPAAGVFPTMLVEMQSGFVQIPHKMNTGDALLLFTDGLEEAQRKFRDRNFNPIVCEEEGLQQGELHDTHPVGNEFEELGIPRIQKIVNAVFDRKQYTLYKYHNPVPDEELVFDFSTCQGTIEEVVLATVAVEKIFRLYPHPSATVDDRIRVDNKLKDFLKEHFKQYRVYFSRPLEREGQAERNSQELIYTEFTHLKEDEQYDDLTILGIRKL